MCVVTRERTFYYSTEKYGVVWTYVRENASAEDDPAAVRMSEWFK